MTHKVEEKEGAMEQVEDRWPVVWMSRKTGISFLTATHERRNAEAIGDDVTRYYPASHPSVLTVEEARLLLKAREDSAMDSGEELDAVRELFGRLSAWVEGEGR